jgi:hypothetical protein
MIDDCMPFLCTVQHHDMLYVAGRMGGWQRLFCLCLLGFDVFRSLLVPAVIFPNPRCGVGIWIFITSAPA